MDRFYTDPFEGPPTIKPPALPEDTYCLGIQLAANECSNGRCGDVSGLMVILGPLLPPQVILSFVSGILLLIPAFHLSPCTCRGNAIESEVLQSFHWLR